MSCSWVAPATRRDGSAAVFKLGMPHTEARHEIAALRLLDGDPTVRLLGSDEKYNAMLLERCEPGTHLRSLFQPDQDVVIAGLLKRFWRVPDEPHPFRSLSDMTSQWIAESLRVRSAWHDASLVTEGLHLLENLSRSSLSNVLLATDLHAGNVLQSRRQPWLVIDPKPYVGDRAYDATQHLLNSRDRLRIDPFDTMQRVADLLEVDYDRVRLWTFARLAAEPRTDWDDDSTAMARLISG
ncbi:MAG TPA: aminoglycoside phosphotransferase family protein [Gemmatimonadaceae bacterium]